MEDLFKFIPIALWIIYKLVGGGKKKERKPNSRPKPAKRNTPEKSTPSLDDILRELSGEKTTNKTETSVPPAQPVYETLAQQREREKIEIEDHQYDFRPEYEHHADVGESLTELREDIRESQGLGTKGLEESTEDEVGFDLKQAIIAQTILARPEY